MEIKENRVEKLKKRGQKRKICGNPRRNKENRPPPLFHSAQRKKRKIFTGVQTIVEKIQEMGGRERWAQPVINEKKDGKTEKFSTFSSHSVENREKWNPKGPKNSTGYERSVEFFLREWHEVGGSSEMIRGNEEPRKFF